MSEFDSSDHGEIRLVTALQQFALLLDNQFEIVHRIIEDALAETTKPRQRLAIYKYLEKRLEELSERVRSFDSNINADGDFLKGPTLMPGKSSYQSSE